MAMQREAVAQRNKAQLAAGRGSRQGETMARSAETKGQKTRAPEMEAVASLRNEP